MYENEMGNRIYQKRKEYGYTMEELGSLVGVNKTAVNKWEKGIVQNIKQTTIKKLSEIFECSPTWLMGFDDEPITFDLPQPEHFTKLNSEDNEYIKMYMELNQEDKDMINKMIKTLYATRNDKK